MAKKVPWYNRDDPVTDPQLAAEAGRYAKLGLEEAARIRRRRLQAAQAKPKKPANPNPFYVRQLGNPVKGSLAWALMTGTFRK